MCVHGDRVWARVSVCTCVQSSGSCKCVYVWIEFRLV